MSTIQAAASVRAPLDGLNAGAAASRTADTDAAGDALGGAVSTLGQTDALFAWSSYFQALAILFLIVTVLFAALWFLKRRGGLNVLTRQGNLLLESRMALGPKKSLIVVRFLNKRMLLGVTDQQITMLTELPTDEDATAQHDPHTANGADFTAHLVRAARNDPENSG
jgi:flagellar protein FliO/FliZ